MKPKKINLMKEPSIFWDSAPKKSYWIPKTKSPSKFKSPSFKPLNIINPKSYPARTKQEWRLIDRKPYGDKDKDKLMNWFDCKPANFGLQGKFHRKPKIGKLSSSEENLIGKLRGKVNERVEDIIYKDSKEEKESSSPRKRRVKNIKLREQRAAEQIKLKELTPILAKTKLMPEDFPETEEQRIKTKILSPPPISKIVSEYNPIFQEIPPYYDNILKKTKELTALSRVRTKKEIEKALEEGGVKTEKEIEVEKLKNTINEKKKQLQRIEAIHETINIKKRSGKKGRQTMERTKKGRLDEVKNELLKLEFQLDKFKKPVSIESNVALVEPIINEKRFIDTSWKKEEIEKAEKDLEEARTKGLFKDKRARVGYSKKEENPVEPDYLENRTMKAMPTKQERGIEVIEERESSEEKEEDSKKTAQELIDEA